MNLIENLIQIKAIQLNINNPFTLTSGLKSPIYCDNRKILHYPNLRNFVIEQYLAIANKMGEFDKWAGVATAGIPYSSILADRTNKTLCYVRSKPKEHGMKNMIEGLILAENKVLVVEDLISTGKSTLQAISAIRETGATVVGAMAIFSYQLEKSIKGFADANCPLAFIENFDGLINTALKIGYISPSDAELLYDWQSDPDNWGKKHGCQ